MISLRTLALSAGAFGALACTPAYATAPAAYAVPSVPVRPITWRDCTMPGTATFASVLGSRLRCGTLLVPLDHHRPDAGDITLTVVRIAAERPDKRVGTLFVNPGGPGGDAGFFATMLASVWKNATPDDRVHGDKRRLAEAFDIVAVIPRGLPGSAPLTCEAELPRRVASILVDRSPRNIAAWDLTARRYADACRADPRQPFISTAQTVYDHDLVRRALGETTFNFYGVSYGTWLGAWYGATYPEHVGRMVFDSSMDFTTSLEANYLLSAPALQETFDRRVVGPAVAKPALYGLGSHRSSVHEVLRGLVLSVRDAWTSRYRAPEDLMAAKAASDWLRSDPALDKAAMRTRIAQQIFSADDTVNTRVRDAAESAVERIYTEATEPGPRLSPMTAMIVTLACNDTPATSDAGAWQEIVASYARDYPAGRSGDLMNPCVFANGPNAVKPPIERLARAGRILMLSSEFDVLTPVAGALRTLNGLPNASLLVLRESPEHMLFTLTDEACVERTTARFLLDGRQPSSQLTECVPDRAKVPGIVHFSRAAEVQAWRRQLSELTRAGQPRMLLMPGATTAAGGTP